MYLDEQQVAELRNILIKRLEPICSADPSVLSTYILALLQRRDKTTQELKNMCKTELRDFLGDETNGFVEYMFGIVEDMEKSSPNININIQFDGDRGKKRAKSPPSPETGLRKRRNEEVRSPVRKQRRSRSPTPKRSRSRSRQRSRSRSSSQRSRSRSRSPRSRSRSRSRSGSPRSHSRSRSPSGIDRELSSKRRGRDDDSRFRSERDDRRRRGDRMDNRGRDMGRRGARGGRREGDFGRPNQPRRRIPCRDYEEKGQCLRGSLCPYDHFSNGDPIVVDDETRRKLPIIGGRASESIPGLDVDEGGIGGSYNPENPYLTPVQPTAIPVWPQQSYQSIPPLTGRGAGQMMQQYPPVLGSGGSGQFSIINPPIPIRNNNDESFLTDLSSGGPLFMSDRGGRGGGRGRGGRGGMRGGGRGITGKRSYNNDNEEGGGDMSGPQGGGGYNQGQDGQGRPMRRRRFEQKRPNTESICVTRIPAELNTIEQLNSHFKKFGTIVNIQIEPSENRAFVQFSNHAEALKALRSPEAVLNNRFIQVYLKREDNEQAQQGPATTPAPVPTPAPVSHPVTPAVPPVPRPVTVPVIPKPKPAPSPMAAKKEEELRQLQKQKEELRKKQLQQQQLILNALSGMKGKSKEKDELVAQLAALTAQLSESMQKEKDSLEVMKKKKAEAAAAAAAAAAVAAPAAHKWKKPGLDTEKDRLDRELELIAKAKVVEKPKSAEEANVEGKDVEEEEGVDVEVDVGEEGGEDSATPTTTATTTTTTTATTTTEDASAEKTRVQVLKDKLTSLQSEAEALGLNTALTSPVAGGYRGRGGIRARGRGMRIRASGRGYWPRGAPRGGRGMRGGPRGGGRGGGMEPRSFKLDNRTTVMSIKSLPEDAREESLLRAHFQNFGNILSLTVTDDTALIQFDNRREAEMAMQYGKTLKGKPLDMSWFDKLRGQAMPEEHPPELGLQGEGGAEGEAGEIEEGEVPVEVVEEFLEDDESYYRAPGEEAEDEEEEGERSWKR